MGRHPVSGTARYSRNDAAALTIAPRSPPTPAQRSTCCTRAIHRIPRCEEYLALGAAKRRGAGLWPEDGDAVAALAARLQGYDLVLTGTRAEGALDSGMLPYQVADALGLPLGRRGVDADGPLTGAPSPSGNSCRKVCVGASRQLASLDRSASDGQRHAALRLREAARRHDRTGSPVDPPANAGDLAWTVPPATAKPVRLAAAEKRSGHARMLSATTTESRGGSVVIEGTSVEKAQVILAYLREHQLVDY